MKMSILLFDGFTGLDVVGGYEVLARVPGMTVEFAACRPGTVAADSGSLAWLPAWRFPSLTAPILSMFRVVPGSRPPWQTPA